MRPARRLPLGGLVLVVALAAGALTGCRSGSALHGRYNNFRAYYNTFYNASRSLEEGERTLRRPDASVDLGRLVPLFPDGDGPAPTGPNTPFQRTIDKSAELLRARGTSAWADDALLLIGKAYFYQRNFVGAEQKFRETEAAATNRGNRRLADEATFWLGRTLASAGRFEEGVAVLQTGLSQQDGDRRWRARMAMALAELYAWAGRWDEAAPALRDGLENVDDDDLAARGYLLLGQVEEAAGRFSLAAEAYAQAARRRPAYELSYAALLSEALVLGLDAGQADAALDRLRAMRRDDKHYPRRAELALAQARVLAHTGDADAAEVLFRDVLYDRTLAGSTVRGPAHARLAEFYRDVREDYVRASAHFDTAASALPSAPTPADHPSREAFLGIERQATTFSSVAATTRRMIEIDSLLALGALDDDAFAARIARINADRLTAWQADQARLAQVRASQEFGGTVAPGLGTTDPGSAGVTSDGPGSASGVTLPGGTPPPTGESGFLSFRDPSSIQNNLVAFQRTWGERPLVPDWRRQAAIQGQTGAAAVGGVSGDNTGPSGSSGPPALDLTVVPRTEGQREVLYTERADLRYQLGNAFFLALDRADLARPVYEQILAETPDAAVALRARYALAELEAAAGNAPRAAALYAEVAASDPDGPLGAAARARAEGREPEPERPAADPADQTAYAQARRLWTDGAPLAAMQAFVQLGDADPDAPLAPRAFFAAAAAYAEWAAGDSLLLARPMPDSLVSATLRAVADDLPRAVSGPATAPSAVAPPPAVPPPATEPPPTAVPDAATVEMDARARLLQEAGRAPEEAVAAPDSVQVPLVVPPLAGEPDVVLADSTERDAPVFTLATHLAALAHRYSSSPYAGTARTLLVTLAPDAPAAEPAAAPAPAPAPAGSLLVGPEPLDPAAAGFSWRLQTASTKEEATTVLESLGGLFRAAVVTDGALFYVVAGQFPDIAAGEATRSDLPGWAQPRAVLVPLGGFTIVETELAAPSLPAPVNRPTEE